MYLLGILLFIEVELIVLLWVLSELDAMFILLIFVDFFTITVVCVGMFHVHVVDFGQIVVHHYLNFHFMIEKNIQIIFVFKRDLFIKWDCNMKWDLFCALSYYPLCIYHFSMRMLNIFINFTLPIFFLCIKIWLARSKISNKPLAAISYYTPRKQSLGGI